MLEGMELKLKRGKHRGLEKAAGKKGGSYTLEIKGSLVRKIRRYSAKGP